MNDLVKLTAALMSNKNLRSLLVREGLRYMDSLSSLGLSRRKSVDDRLRIHLSRYYDDLGITGRQKRKIISSAVKKVRNKRSSQSIRDYREEVKRRRGIFRPGDIVER